MILDGEESSDFNINSTFSSVETQDDCAPPCVIS